MLLSSPAGAPRYVDAIVVLGGDGGMGGRYARGLDLVAAGYSKRLVLTFPSAGQIKDAKSMLPDTEIVDSAPAPGSWGEAVAVRDLMQARGFRSVMVVSDPPHMLRLLYTWGSIFRGTGLEYSLVATNPTWWSDWGWWRNRQASDFVSNEVLKLGYYLMKHCFGF